MVCSCQAARHTCVLFIFGAKNKIMGLIDKVFWIELVLEKSGFPQKMSESSTSINLTLAESCLLHQLKWCSLSSMDSRVWGIMLLGTGHIWLPKLIFLTVFPHSSYRCWQAGSGHTFSWAPSKPPLVSRQVLCFPAQGFHLRARDAQGKRAASPLPCQGTFLWLGSLTDQLNWHKAPLAMCNVR